MTASDRESLDRIITALTELMTASRVIAHRNPNENHEAGINKLLIAIQLHQEVR